MATTNSSPIQPASGIVEAVDNLLLLLFSLFTWDILLLVWAFGMVMAALVGGGAALLIRWILGYQDEWKKSEDGKKDEPPEPFLHEMGATLVLQIAALICLNYTDKAGNLTLLGLSIIAVLVFWLGALAGVSVGVAIGKEFKIMYGKGVREGEDKLTEEEQEAAPQESV